MDKGEKLMGGREGGREEGREGGKIVKIIHDQSLKKILLKNCQKIKPVFFPLKVEDAHLRPDTPEPRTETGKGFYLKRPRRSVSLMKHVEALLVVDQTMTEYYANRDLETYLFTIMNMVS